MKACLRKYPLLLSLLLAACGGGSGGSEGTQVRVSPDNVVATAKTTGIAPRSRLDVSVDHRPGRTISPFVEYTTAGIARVQVVFTSETSGRVSIFFQDPDLLGPGTYADRLTLKICYDAACSEQTVGSPRQIEVSYTVTGAAAPPPEADIADTAAPADGGSAAVTQLPMADHNVVDAAYSKSLEAVVMVSTQPANALYVYDTASDTERMLALSGPPTALSLSPDGRTAAILLDGSSLAYAELTASGDLAAARMQPLSVLASDLMLGANRIVHLLPAPFAFGGFITSINLDTAVPHFSEGGVPNDMQGVLHPAGNAIYAMPPLAAPGDILKYELTDNGARKLYESADDGAHPGCGNLWLSAGGNRIYSACGNVFRASDYRVNDLSYMGRIALFGPTGGIQSLSDSTAAGEIALVETRFEGCYRAPLAECSSRINLYDRGTLAPAGSYALRAGDIGGFVFHDSDGDRLYVVARVYADPSLPPAGPANLLLKLSKEP
ncbi:hypothetical protein D0B54_08270 [Solimonas sp. K1W22B-7]|uniref:hypothetical protein n=1 Tax=Solimonas sp. K1W22B-7 TaxID=2303331 RepID=UPI000E337685|nr:hypothetical protein [Solimonas sp. K1W22B-7]AXQ28673.1 hypothetical protein D0B54_08270 [Solimonas sp. K1W22B-7]